ncbi:PREDICTED: uncharacterized protein LOC105951008 [Erythranthe guttata]|uniref:uncharacterized protein LOC105951008 n=1 Tax=Erythranthe guttata TaxID=4155 RepID=UPI00064E059B|nr:PREDICTED: uncharacterized protein LOC105951008 [Erythranthe guttata]|eukprot:XP_012829855.1 PREDICTED: uncharacterized protein LOC105951008 [Erythranthe guttata]
MSCFEAFNITGRIFRKSPPRTTTLPPNGISESSIDFIVLSIAIPTSLYSHASGIKTLSGSNFSEWYEQIQFTLGVMDLDLALLTEKPGEITDANSGLPEVDNAMELLTAIKERFKSADKSLAGTLMAELTTMKYGGDKGIQEHILNRTDKAAKLGALGMKVEESFLIYV